MTSRITRRCGICNLNWYDHTDYAVCPQCDGETDRCNLPNEDDQIDSYGESHERAKALKAAEDAEVVEARRLAVAARTALARRAKAAAAALHHDADNLWLEVTPAELDAWRRGA